MAAKGSEQQGLRPRSVLSKQQRKQSPNHMEGDSECFQQRLQKKQTAVSLGSDGSWLPSLWEMLPTR